MAGVLRRPLSGQGVADVLHDAVGGGLQLVRVERRGDLELMHPERLAGCVRTGGGGDTNQAGLLE